MFNNWIWGGGGSDGEAWEDVGTYDVSIPTELQLRANTFAIETEEGKMIDIEGDDHVIMHRTGKVTFQRNEETDDLRAFYEREFLGKRKFLGDDEVEYLLDKVQNQE